MLKFFTYLLLLFAVAIPLHAELAYQGDYNPDMSLSDYFSAENPQYSQSLIYVFYNSETCYNCPQTIELIEQVYNEYFKNQYQLFIIDYFDDDEYNFVANYNLSSPVSMVLQRVSDGTLGEFKKFADLQNQISDPVSFQENIKFQIESFLGN